LTLDIPVPDANPADRVVVSTLEKVYEYPVRGLNRKESFHGQC
jgi:hypothetical protein